jgi:hypothetical protein
MSLLRINGITYTTSVYVIKENRLVFNDEFQEWIDENGIQLKWVFHQLAYVGWIKDPALFTYFKLRWVIEVA